MSNSYKKNKIGKQSGFLKKFYYKIIRRTYKSTIKNCDNLKELELKNSKELINDCDYIDRTYICSEDCYCTRKFGFKKCLSK